MAAGIALIYCFPQIVKGSFNTKLLKYFSTNLRSYLFPSLLLLSRKAVIQLWNRVFSWCISEIFVVLKGMVLAYFVSGNLLVLLLSVCL